jgi:hypothetical protein
MTRNDDRYSYKINLMLAGVMVFSGLAISGMALAEIAKTPNVQLAQATPPLQSTPGAESKPSAPAEPTTTGARPQETPPQPARPDGDAQKSGAESALPAAPAEKTAAPITTK